MTRQEEMQIEPLFQEAAINAENEQNYLGSTTCVQILLRRFLTEAVNDERPLIELSEQFAKTFLGMDEHFKPVPGWNEPGSIDQFVKDEINTTETDATLIMRHAFFKILNEVLELAKWSETLGVLDEQWKSGLESVVSENVDMLLGIKVSTRSTIDFDTLEDIEDRIKTCVVEAQIGDPERRRQAKSVLNHYSISTKGLKAYLQVDEYEEAEKRRKDQVKAWSGQEYNYLPDWKTVGEKKQYSSTQFNIAEGGYSRSQGSPLETIQSMAMEIEDADLHEKGREDLFHVTIKYGIHTDVPTEIEQAVRGFGPVEITLGKTSVFVVDKEDPFEVVKIEVFGDRLHQLNKLVSESTEVTDTFPTYVPHITLAYVQPGMGEKYVGLVNVEGQKLNFTEFTFSDHTRNFTTISLMQDKKMALIDDAGSGGVEAAPVVPEYCPYCNAHLEMGDDGKCNRCGKPWKDSIQNAKNPTEMPTDKVTTLIKGLSASSTDKENPFKYYDMKINTNPQAILAAKGFDTHGWLNIWYNKKSWTPMMLDRMKRIQKVFNESPIIEAQLLKSQDDAAKAALLVFKLGIRVGEENEKEVSGAATLRGKHVIVRRDHSNRNLPRIVFLKFMGRAGNEVSIEVDDPEVKKLLIERKYSTNPQDRIFKTTSEKVHSCISGLGHGGCSEKDLRSFVATKFAMHYIDQTDASESSKDFKQSVKSIAQKVADKIGSTKVAVLQSYIDPVVFSMWR